MIIIPAIDLKQGKCVRLRQGNMESSTVFNEDPPAQAKLWESAGARRVHVVDLDGSVCGKPANFETIRDIVAAIRVPVQLGGGIRDESTIRMYLDVGVSSVILGTIAARDPERVLDLLDKFPGRIAVGIDAKDGKVAVQGWTEETEMRAAELARRFDSAGAAAFIYTDISRDGMMQGPNIDATREFAQDLSTPVILSGGVSTIDDVRAAVALEMHGVNGIIVGRALYEGRINLEEAISVAEGRNAR